ncbi:MAG: flagellar hook-associated protein FlgK [Alphaproteobacteria bacterium]|nr:flagellar hook-associated protein FlgK [Alphaproteobacteria bacterium]
MSLDAALNSALTGLRASQSALALISSNISNANTDGYTKRILNQSVLAVDGTVAGTQIEGVSRVVDSFVLSDIQSQNTEVGYANVRNDYYQLIQNQFGQPDSHDSLTALVDATFSALQQFSNDVEMPSLRSAAVNNLNQLAGKISGTASSLETFRFRADQEISSSIKTINDQIDNLNQLNNQIRDNKTKQAPTDALEEQRDNILSKLSQYLNIAVTNKTDGRIVVNTGSGVPLLDDTVYHLKYDPATSVNTFTENSPLSSLTLVPLDVNGNETGVPTVLATGGTSDQITTTLKSGKLMALLDLRDNEIPKILDQLDSLARQLADGMNAIHNDGVGFPGAQSLTGTRSLLGNEDLEFSGSVRFAVLDKNGQPVTRPYPDLPYYPPLTVNLAALNGGSHNGQFNTADFIKEFNNHFSAAPTRLDMGNLFNVRLAATSDVATPNGSFSFNFELQNYSGQAASFEILGITVSGGGTVNSGAPSSSAFNINPGEETRTDAAHSVSVTFGSGSGPYTISANVRVSNGKGGFDTQTIQYTVNQGGSLLNQRYSASALVPPNTAQIIPGNSQPYAKAIFVNDQGQEIDPNGYEPGHLKIVSGSDEFTIAIDELDSKQLGIVKDPAKPGTGFGFSHYFGLNDLLLTNGETKNSALSLRLREDILANPQLLSAGKLTLTQQSTDPTQDPVYSYEVGSGSNETSKELSVLQGNLVIFGETSTLPSGARTFSGYVSEIISYTASHTSQASTYQQQQKLIQDGFTQKFESTSGVNIDEELAHTVFFQNAYSASAKIVSVTSKLFDDLMNMV